MKKRKIKPEDCKYEIGGQKVSESVFYKSIAVMIKKKNKKDLKKHIIILDEEIDPDPLPRI